ncbi:MAG: recombinase family protein [Thermomicrobiales bacterium]
MSSQQSSVTSLAASTSPEVERIERRGSVSRFESLLRLEDAKASTSERAPGTGAAVLYLRVSTQRQMHTAIDLDPDGNSIATQREATQKRAKRLKVPIAEEFVEPGHSAQSIAKRPVFRELLTYLEDHPEVGYVIIRNQTDAAITKRILASMDVKLISAKEEFGEGYMADAMEAITDIMNEVQVRQSGEDIKNKMFHKAKNGGTTGRAKIGYLNARKDIDGHLVNTIEVDPKRAPLVAWAFEQYATGDYSLTRLQEELAEQGLTTRRTARWEEKALSRSQLGVLLRDSYYLGMVTYKGQTFPGKHEALVSAEVFERVQQVLDARMQRNQRDITHNHFLRGMLRCGRCHDAGRKRQLVYTQAVNRHGTMYTYYLCIGSQHHVCDLPHLPVALVEEAVLREVQRLQLTPEAITTMREEVATRLDQRLNAEREAHTRVQKELVALDVKEERLLDLAADGTLTTSKVQDRLRTIQVQRTTLNHRLATTADIVQQEADTLLRYLDLLERPGAFYAAATDNVKRKLLKAFFSHIWIDDDGYQVTSETQCQPLVQEIEASARMNTTHENTTEQLLGGVDSLRSPLLLFGAGSNKSDLVPGKGLQGRHVVPC